jgi:uncharacterized protein involved in exopolysaccharide biosynthesis
LQSYIIQQEKLSNDVQLNFQIFNQLSAQLQASKAKVQENTPAFTIIQGPTVPYKPSSTPKIFVAAFVVILGVIIDAIWVLFGEQLWINYKKIRTK